MCIERAAAAGGASFGESEKYWKETEKTLEIISVFCLLPSSSLHT